MKFTPLPSREIKAAYLSFSDHLKRGKPFTKKLTWRPGFTIRKVYWHEKQKYWGSPGTTDHWCPLGVTDPSTSGTLRMTCQINPAYDDSDRSRGGVFLKDARGHIYIAHNGNVGGGVSGVGKIAFLDFYQGDLEDIEWGDGTITKVIVIDRLGSRTLLDNLGAYVHEVASFKRSVAAGTQRKRPQLKFTPEFFGRRKKYMLTKAIESFNWHGYVVKELQEHLKARGISAFNTGYVDLYVTRGSQMTHVFEIKTDAVRDSVYKAIGQVMLHGTYERTAPNRIVVLPRDVTTQAKVGLKKLGIRLLTYRWNGSIPVFDDIGNVL